MKQHEATLQEFTAFFTTVGISLLLLVAWEGASRYSVQVNFLLSRPSQIVDALVTMAISGTLIKDIGVTAGEALVGTGTGTFLGSGFGLALWLSKRATRIAAPFVVVGANFPVFALAPAAIVWLGIGIGMKVFLAAFATFFISLNLAYQGAKTAHKLYSGVFDGFNASNWDTYTKVIVPGALDAVFDAMRVNIGLGILGAFIGEFIASEQGLGRVIIRASGLYHINEVFAASLCIIMLAAVFDLLARGIQQEKVFIARAFGVPRRLRLRSGVLAERTKSK